MMFSYAKSPFLLHIVVETFAGSTFVLRPQAQLQPLTPAASLILQSYGGLLIFSNLISLIFMIQPFEQSSRLACWAFAYWHLWPCWRAMMRIRKRINIDGELGSHLGGPTVHLLVHGALFLDFVFVAMLIS
jgi:hypothetical protein